MRKSSESVGTSCSSLRSRNLKDNTRNMWFSLHREPSDCSAEYFVCTCSLRSPPLKKYYKKEICFSPFQEFQVGERHGLEQGPQGPHSPRRPCPQPMRPWGSRSVLDSHGEWHGDGTWLENSPLVVLICFLWLPTISRPTPSLKSVLMQIGKHKSSVLKKVCRYNL